MVVQRIRNAKVEGSNPFCGTTFLKDKTMKYDVENTSKMFAARIFNMTENQFFGFLIVLFIFLSFILFLPLALSSGERAQARANVEETRIIEEAFREREITKDIKELIASGYDAVSARCAITGKPEDTCQMVWIKENFNNSEEIIKKIVDAPIKLEEVKSQLERERIEKAQEIVNNSKHRGSSSLNAIIGCAVYGQKCKK